MPRKSKKSLRSSEQRRTTTSVIRDASYKWISIGYPEIQFTWVIDNFSVWIEDLKARSRFAYSPEFPTEPSATKWSLLFHIDEMEPYDQDTSDDDSYETDPTISLYLQPAESLVNIMEVQFDVTIYGDHKKLYFIAMPLEFKPDSDELQGCKEVISLHKLVSWVKMRGDKLVISCTAVIRENLFREVEEKPAKSSSEDIQKFHVASVNLNSDMKKLLDMDQFGDVELVVGDRKFSAYKGILAARSTVFADMFQGQLKRFVLGGIEPDLFQEVLRYIYTDQVSDLGALKFQLFAAAHRYNIGSLKQLCRDAILAGLSLETVADVLKVGAMCEDPELKHQALAFIWKGPIGITKTRGWQELIGTHRHLADEALEVLAKKVALRCERN